MSLKLAYWIATLFLPDVGFATINKWLSTLNDIEAIFNSSDHALLAVGAKASQIAAIRKINWSLIHQEMDWINERDQHIICFDSKDYPQQLKEIAYPPLVLYVKGNKSILSHHQLAIVGSRKASPLGCQIAKEMAIALAKANFTITSGLALGIDRASHEGALLAEGQTIGVTGTGLHYVYPSRNRLLINQIMEKQGAIISEFPLNTPPQARNFPRRNRIISGLSKGILIVEAAIKSGSLITARHALEQGKEVFAVPHSIHHPLGKGCHYLIQQGAKLVEKAEDIISELGLLRTLPLLSYDKLKERPELHLSKDEEAVFKWINYEIASLDMIILRSGLTASQVCSILLRLELNGHILSVSGGYIRASQ